MDQLSVRSMTKVFAGNAALKDVSLELRAGKIHCLVGENGAGKSTIIKILAGHYQPDQGTIFIDGEETSFPSPRAARLKGIAVIHQELQLIPEMSVAENISLGQWPVQSRLFIDKKSMIKRAEQVLAQLGLPIDPMSPVSKLSIGQQQLVEISRALSFDAKVMILDEPTASLAQHETELLLQIVNRLKNRGVAILYVSHRLEEVFNIADTITIFRDGRNVGTFDKNEIVPEKVVQLMVGKMVTLHRELRNKAGDKILEVKNLTRKNHLHNINFALRRGEILGLGGLIGAGRTEVLRCLFGIDSYDEGEIWLEGEQVIIRNPLEAIEHGIGLVPEDRKTQGLMLGLSMKDNTSISVLSQMLSRFGWIHNKREVQLVEDYQNRLKIRTQSIDTVVNSLSGGNQQKVILSRWIAIKPKVLLLDEPTRGVDIGARQDIQHLIEQLVDEGVAIVVVSSDIEELLQLCDRILIMKGGKIVKELLDGEMTKETALYYATGSVNSGKGGEADERHSIEEPIS